MKKYFSILIMGITIQVTVLSALMVGLRPTSISALSGADFRADRIIDDAIFYDSNSMGAADIQAFLNSKMPSCDTWHAGSGSNQPPFTCLNGYSQDIGGGRPADAYCSGAVGGGIKTAAQIIKDVSVACGINPKVLIVLLQKEQSLVTDTWPWNIQYEHATGYACPDTAPCDPEFAGFFNQVWYAARQFQRYVKQPHLFSYKASQVNFIQWSPNASCGGNNVFIQNDPTAALYNYTPYQPNAAALNNLYGTGDGCSAYGNRNFWRLFNDWFGSTLTDKCNYNAPGQIITDVSFRNFQPGIGAGNFVIYSGTGSNCIESHTWGSGFSHWQNNTASNHPVINPSSGAVVKYADLSGDGRDEPILLAFNNTGSGKVEFHVWEYSMKKWIVHAISNLSTSEMTNLSIEFADFDGDGRDEPVAIGYQNTGSGKVEFHTWVPGLQQWAHHAVSNLDAPLNPVNMQIRFADLDGNGADEGIALGLAGTETGKIEYHVWNPGFWSWRSHNVSNAGIVDVNNFDLQFADFDGDRFDNGVLVGKRNTATGRIEFHVWNPGGLHTWQGHYVSNQSIL